MKTLLVITALSIAVLACGKNDSASSTVKEFSQALADSSYHAAWELITPQSQQWYDSTAAVLHQFGWQESQEAVTNLAGEMTEEEFQALTGEDIFTRMVERSEDVHNLSTSIKSVTYPDSLVGVVVVRTDNGLQEVTVRKVGDQWLIDLTSLVPPVQGG